MKTEIISQIDQDLFSSIKQNFESGLPVVVPSETVYGLAAPYNNLRAVKQIFVVKGRPQDNPLITHISCFEQLNELVVPGSYSETCKQIMKKFWPGPLTILFQKSDNVNELITAGSDLIAVRMPSHPIFRQIIENAGVPLVAPSANISGKPSPTNAKDCFEDLDGLVEIIVDGGDCDFGLESTVIKFIPNGSIKILRPGSVTKKDLEEFATVEIDSSVLESGASESETKVESPGMKYKHYSPTAKIAIVKDSEIALLNLKADEYLLSVNLDVLDLAKNEIRFKSEEEMAQKLFTTFRHLDRLKATKIFVQFPKDNLALQNRILKASG